MSDTTDKVQPPVFLRMDGKPLQNVLISSDDDTPVHYRVFNGFKGPLIHEGDLKEVYIEWDKPKPTN